MAGLEERDNKKSKPSSATPLANSAVELKNVSSPSKDTNVPLSTTKPRRKPLNKGTWRQWVAALVISFPFFIVGMSLGWPSPVLYRIRDFGEPLNLTTTEVSLVVTLFYVGNIGMPIPGGVLADLVGRKTSLLIMSILPVSSWVMIYFPFHPSMLFGARILAGMWSGMVQTVVPIYIGEIVESKSRGKISALSQLYLNIGVVLVYLIGREVSYYTLAIVSGVMPVCFVIMILFIPESPFWLFYTNSPAKAEKNLFWLRGEDIHKMISPDVEEEEIVIARAIKSDLHKPQGWQMLFKVKGYRIALIIVEVISISQRLSGISSVMAYASITLPDQTIWNLTPNDFVTLIGVSWFLGCITCLSLVDKFGKVPLLLASCAGSGLGMLTVFVWFVINRSTEDYSVPWVPFVGLFWYGLCFNLGLGPLPTTIQGELFPSHLKAAASALTSMVLAIASVCMNGVYLYIARTAGMFVNYAIFTITCVACFIFTWFYVMETKGKTLPEIQNELKNIH